MQPKLDITYLYYIPFMLSAIFSLKSFWLKWPKHLRTFSYFLIVTLVIEALGDFWKWGVFRWFGSIDENVWIFNIGMIIGRAILLLYFLQLLSSIRLKKILTKLIPAYLVFSIINYFLIQGPRPVNTYSVNIGSILVIFFCIRYFMELLSENEVFKLHSLPEFWIATGTFIYFLSSIPFITSFDLFAREKELYHIMIIFMRINDVLMIFTYTLYLIAYLCRPHTKSLYKLSSFPH